MKNVPVGILIIVVIGGLGVGGWVANVVKLCGCNFTAPYKAEFIRAVGVVVPPIGAVCGYLNIED